MKVTIHKEPIDSRKYNVKYSEDFSLDFPLVFVRFEDFNWIWIPKYKEILEIVQQLLTYKGSKWFKEKLEMLIKNG